MPVPRATQMPVDLPETTSKIGGPLVKQFSVFLPNKVGAMLDIVKLLNTNNTHVVALSVSESTDSAIARIIVSDPERGEKLFHQKNVAFGVCEDVVVEMREVASQRVKLLAALFMAELHRQLTVLENRVYRHGSIARCEFFFHALRTPIKISALRWVCF